MSFLDDFDRGGSGSGPSEHQASGSGSLDDKPLFSLKKLDWKVSLRSRSVLGETSLKCMAAGNNVLILATTGRTGSRLIRWALDSEDPEDVGIGLRGSDEIHSVFIDPSGAHALINLENGDSYYLNSRSKKARLLARMKGVVVESVAWDKHNATELSTRTILVGSATGVIYETVIDAKAGKERYWKEVCNLKDPIPICGLQFELFPVQPSEPPKYFVMAATARPTRYYQFVGGPSFEALFGDYSTPDRESFIELPGDLPYSELHFYTKYLEERAKSFTLLTGVGVYHGNLRFGSQSAGDKVIIDYALLPYPTREAVAAAASSAGVGDDDGGVAEAGGGSHGEQVPISMAESEFHFLLLYPSRLVVVSKLSKAVVHKHSFSRRLAGRMLGLTRDPARGTTWLFSAQHVQQVVITNEDRNVWQLYLSRAQHGDPNEFLTAYAYCKTDEQRDQVLTMQADHYFAQREYELAAKYYAETRRSFEEVSLMLIDRAQRDALKCYLTLKLKALPPNAKTQRTLLSIWLVEIFLDKLNALHEGGNDAPSASGAAADPEGVESANGGGDALVEAESQLLYEFWEFLHEQRDALEPAQATVFNLIASHGRVDELLFYAKLVEDYERVITHHMQRGDYDKAVETLTEQADKWRGRGRDPPETIQTLYYKYAAVLIEHSPSKTVDAWIEAGRFLDPCLLIPALVRFSQARHQKCSATGGGDHAVRYLEFCIKENGNRDSAIHNYLLSLYAESESEERLQEFLAAPGPCFDLKYALRICSEKGRTRACVQIYAAMGLYEEAVHLALQVDVELAKSNADKAEDAETRKKLWLQIARQAITDHEDIKGAIQVLHESEALQIEDLLPFFPDFVVIDDFKEEICNSLEQYNSLIANLKSEMDEFTENAELVRQDIAAQRDRVHVVAGSQCCDLCGKPVLSRAFYVFPCSHSTHRDCLMDEVCRHLSTEQRAQVDRLRTQLETDVGDGKDTAQNRADTTLDDFIAAACPFCGELMIQSIAEPFVRPDEEAEAASWSVA